MILYLIACIRSFKSTNLFNPSKFDPLFDDESPTGFLSKHFLPNDNKDNVFGDVNFITMNVSGTNDLPEDAESVIDLINSAHPTVLALQGVKQTLLDVLRERLAPHYQVINDDEYSRDAVTGDKTYVPIVYDTKLVEVESAGYFKTKNHLVYGSYIQVNDARFGGKPSYTVINGDLYSSFADVVSAMFFNITGDVAEAKLDSRPVFFLGNMGVLPSDVKRSIVIGYKNLLDSDSNNKKLPRTTDHDKGNEDDVQRDFVLLRDPEGVFVVNYARILRLYSNGTKYPVQCILTYKETLEEKANQAKEDREFTEKEIERRTAMRSKEIAAGTLTQAEIREEVRQEVKQRCEQREQKQEQEEEQTALQEEALSTSSLDQRASNEGAESMSALSGSTSSQGMSKEQAQQEEEVQSASLHASTSQRTGEGENTKESSSGTRTESEEGSSTRLDTSTTQSAGEGENTKESLSGTRTESEEGSSATRQSEGEKESSTSSKSDFKAKDSAGGSSKQKTTEGGSVTKDRDTTEDEGNTTTSSGNDSSTQLKDAKNNKTEASKKDKISDNRNSSTDNTAGNGTSPQADVEDQDPEQQLSNKRSTGLRDKLRSIFGSKIGEKSFLTNKAGSSGSSETTTATDAELGVSEIDSKYMDIDTGAPISLIDLTQTTDNSIQENQDSDTQKTESQTRETDKHSNNEDSNEKTTTDESNDQSKSNDDQDEKAKDLKTEESNSSSSSSDSESNIPSIFDLGIEEVPVEGNKVIKTDPLTRKLVHDQVDIEAWKKLKINEENEKMKEVLRRTGAEECNIKDIPILDDKALSPVKMHPIINKIVNADKIKTAEEIKHKNKKILEEVKKKNEEVDEKLRKRELLNAKLIQESICSLNKVKKPLDEYLKTIKMQSTIDNLKKSTHCTCSNVTQPQSNTPTIVNAQNNHNSVSTQVNVVNTPNTLPVSNYPQTPQVMKNNPSNPTQPAVCIPNVQQTNTPSVSTPLNTQTVTQGSTNTQPQINSSTITSHPEEMSYNFITQNGTQKKFTLKNNQSISIEQLKQQNNIFYNHTNNMGIITPIGQNTNPSPQQAGIQNCTCYSTGSQGQLDSTKHKPLNTSQIQNVTQNNKNITTQQPQNNIKTSQNCTCYSTESQGQLDLTIQKPLNTSQIQNVTQNNTTLTTQQPQNNINTSQNCTCYSTGSQGQLDSTKHKPLNTSQIQNNVILTTSQPNNFQNTINPSSGTIQINGLPAILQPNNSQNVSSQQFSMPPIIKPAPPQQSPIQDCTCYSKNNPQNNIKIGINTKPLANQDTGSQSTNQTVLIKQNDSIGSVQSSNTGKILDCNIPSENSQSSKVLKGHIEIENNCHKTKQNEPDLLTNILKGHVNTIDTSDLSKSLTKKINPVTVVTQRNNNGNKIKTTITSNPGEPLRVKDTYPPKVIQQQKIEENEACKPNLEILEAQKINSEIKKNKNIIDLKKPINNISCEEAENWVKKAACDLEKTLKQNETKTTMRSESSTSKYIKKFKIPSGSITPPMTSPRHLKISDLIGH